MASSRRSLWHFPGVLWFAFCALGAADTVRRCHELCIHVFDVYLQYSPESSEPDKSWELKRAPRVGVDHESEWTKVEGDVERSVDLCLIAEREEVRGTLPAYGLRDRGGTEGLIKERGTQTGVPVHG